MQTGQMADGRNKLDAEELRRVLREQAGLGLVRLAPTSGGESRHAFWVAGRAGPGC